MKKFLKFVLTFLFLSPLFSASADWKESLREKIGPVLGSEWTEKLLGPMPETILLPEIPEVGGDAKSLDVYKNIEDQNLNKIPKEDFRKFNIKFIYELYSVVREGKATDKDVEEWMNVLQQGGTREGIYRAMVLDRGYASKEGMEFPLKKEAYEFLKKFFAEFLNRNVTDQILDKSNLYTMKKAMTERMLDILDVYLLENRKNDFYNWYAVYSSEIAKRFPATLNGKLRGHTSREVHLKWAQGVPLQFVKSEVILKTHLIMNQYR
ncbi:MAG: hypothetical protein ACPGJV_05730 [Bacteriovoracaceae bacterium]